MTKKDYIAVAKELKDLRDSCGTEAEKGLWYAMMFRMGNIFAKDNPKFSRNRFEDACGGRF